MNSRSGPVLGVIGEGDCSPEMYQLAQEVGRLAAQRGAVLVCGGLGGVMEAACRGATEAGGLTMGILPGADREAANPFVTLAIPTALGEARNLLVVRAADALVAVGGKYGTLSEIAFALKIGKPLVGLHSWGLIQEGRKIDPFPVCQTPSEAVEVAFQLMGKFSTRNT